MNSGSSRASQSVNAYPYGLPPLAADVFDDFADLPLRRCGLMRSSSELK